MGVKEPSVVERALQDKDVLFDRVDRIAVVNEAAVESRRPEDVVNEEGLAWSLREETVGGLDDASKDVTEIGKGVK